MAYIGRVPSNPCHSDPAFAGVRIRPLAERRAAFFSLEIIYAVILVSSRYELLYRGMNYVLYAQFRYAQ